MLNQRQFKRAANKDFPIYISCASREGNIPQASDECEFCGSPDEFILISSIQIKPSEVLWPTQAEK